MKKTVFYQALSALSSFAAASFVLGLASVPGLYLLGWAFRRFLIDAVFTGRAPDPGEILFFGFFLGASLCLFILAAALILAGGCRLLIPLKRGEAVRRASMLLLEGVLKLLPGPRSRDFFRRLSGPG